MQLTVQIEMIVLHLRNVTAHVESMDFTYPPVSCKCAVSQVFIMSCKFYILTVTVDLLQKCLTVTVYTNPLGILFGGGGGT